ncbi:MaoC/PaaZ C-terminal domain-containing protein [Baekduia sp. Peel2402]|uniref:MaoC/PaaZ C-terminal domain-containing protein n=1 Tax=Baekduia sp. Peel2402 TaxID=3458296 RepID=UPI00403EF1A4
MSDVKTRTLDGPPGAASLYPRAVAGSYALPFLRKVPVVGPGKVKGLPDLAFALQDVALDAGHVADYARVCGFTLRDALPPTYLHILAFPLQMRLMTDGAFPFGVLGLVHVENRIDVLRPVTTGEKVSFRVHAEDLRDHPRGKQFDMVSIATVGDERVWEGRSTYLRRGGGTDPNHPGDAAKKDDKKSAPPVAESIWKIPGDIGRRYGAVSGDRNPIHLHNLSAKAFGMPRAIAHGMWLKARALAQLEAELPPTLSVEVRFKLPVLLPATVGFSSQAAEGGRAFAVHDAKKGLPHLDGHFAARAG